MGANSLTLEDLEEILVPMFYAVIIYNYDPSTAIAYMDKEMLPGTDYRECLEYIRDIANELVPDITVVDIGYIYSGTHTNIHAWWIQFKIA